MSSSSGESPQNGMSIMTTQEMEAVITKLEADNFALRRELLSSRQQGEDRLSVIDEMNKRIQALEDQQRLFQMDNMLLKGKLVISRHEHEDKDACIRDLQDQLHNLKTGNSEAFQRLFSTNAIIQKQQCEIMKMLMSNDDSNPRHSESPKNSGSGNGAGNKDQKSSQPSSYGERKSGSYGGETGNGSSSALEDEEMYDPSVPMMMPGSAFSNGRSLLNPSMFGDSNIIRSSSTSSTQRVFIKQERKE